MEANEIRRPRIEHTFIDMNLSQVHLEYQKSPLLYMHVRLLDNYIDNLEDGILHLKQLQTELKEARGIIKGIEAFCDNNNPTHEVIWRIANEYLTK